MRILCDAGATGGGGGATPAEAPFSLDMVPEALRGEPALASYKTIPALAKSLVESQKLIGAKRIAIPGEKASPAEWDSFYNSIGRPDSHDKYELPKVEVDPSLKPDDTKLAEVRKLFHTAGLTTKQASMVMEYYMKSMDSQVKGQRSASEQSATQAITQLRESWGDKYDANVEIANSVLRKFGDEGGELAKYLETSGMGNNTALIKMLYKIGTGMLDDHQRQGGQSLDLNDTARAQREIEELKVNKEFQDALSSRSNPGHQAAVDRWTNLFKIAFPGKQQE